MTPLLMFQTEDGVNEVIHIHYSNTIVELVVKVELLLTTQLVTQLLASGAVTVTVTMVPGTAVDKSVGLIETVAPRTPRFVSVARQRSRTSLAVTARARCVVGRVARRTAS
jgi:hypothetical protein